MLPWKRHKFELRAEEPRQPSKPKGYARSLRRAALGSLARACPERALQRLGSMFRSRRRTFRVSGEEPSYTALYLGNAATLQARGEGCTEPAVGKIWARSEAGRRGTRVRLSIGAQGIRVAPADGGERREQPRRPGHLYLLHRVTYCGADPRLPRVFAWVYRHELRHKAEALRCHAVLVSRAEKARAMALLLFQTSAAALADFRRLKRRQEARRQRAQRVGEEERGPPPGPCSCYKPPAERGRGAPRLGPIAEDPQGEEREREEPERERGRPRLSRLVGELGGLSLGGESGGSGSRAPPGQRSAEPAGRG